MAEETAGEEGVETETRTEEALDKESQEKIETAKREAARRIRGRIFATLNVLVVVLSIVAVGIRDNWAFLSDVMGHLESWRDILAAIVGGLGVSWAVSFSFTRLAITNVLTQLVDARVMQVINKYKTVYNNHPSDQRVGGELSELRQQVKTLEGLLEIRKADRGHIDHIEDFLKYAESKRIEDLKQQLLTDVELFDRVREAMSRFAQEFELQSKASRRIAE
jgi:hypothetical protein